MKIILQIILTKIMFLIFLKLRIVYSKHYLFHVKIENKIFNYFIQKEIGIKMKKLQHPERIKLVFSILKSQTKIKFKGNAFEKYKFEVYTKREIKKFNQNALNVREIFEKGNYKSSFNPRKLIGLISENLKDESTLNHLGFYILDQYVAFLVQYEENKSIDIVTLFNALTIIYNHECQDLVDAALLDIFYILFQNLSFDLISIIFSPLSDYFISNPSANKEVASYLPLILQELMNMKQENLNFHQIRDYLSFLSLICSHRKKYLEKKEIAEIFELIQPYIKKLNKYGFDLLENMIYWLDESQLIYLFQILPCSIFYYIETNDYHLVLPPEIEYEFFEPSGTECNFNFSKVETFKNGIKLLKTNTFESPDINILCDSHLQAIMNYIARIINDNQKYVENFLKASIIFLQSKNDSKFLIDFYGFLVLFYYKISDKIQLDSIEIPEKLFNPGITLYNDNGDENQNNTLYSLHYYSILSLLKISPKTFEKLLLSTTGYPLLFSEIVEFCILFIDQFNLYVKSDIRIIRTIRLIGLQLQHEELHSTISLNSIECARISLLRLISSCFANFEIAKLFLEDVLFLPFFLSLLYEKNIRYFILMHIQNYINSMLASENLVLSICQIIDQACPYLPDKKYLLLITDLVSIIRTSKNSDLSYIFICNSLKSQFDNYDNSKESYKLLIEIIKFFAIIDELPATNITALETPLKKFNLGKKEFYELCCLLSGREVEGEKLFNIKNGQTMNLLFHLYINNSEIDFIKYAQNLCAYSRNNCYKCHQCGFDISLLNYVLLNRDSNDPKISEILSLVSTIALVISSPAVVQLYISLFVPFEGRYLSNIHHNLLKPLHSIFANSLDNPYISFPLSFEYTQKIQFQKDLLSSFSFIFWICYDSISNANLFKLAAQEKVLFSLTMIDGLLYLNDKSTGCTIPKNRWCNICIDNFEQMSRLYIDSSPIYATYSKFEQINGSFMMCIGGGSCKYAEICNFGLYQHLSKKQIRALFLHGPRTTKILFSPIFYNNAFDLYKMVPQYPIIQKNKINNFVDILLSLFKIEILLPLFAQIDLPLKSGEEHHFKILDVLSILDAAFLVGETEQASFAKAKGFSIISHLLCSLSPYNITNNLYLSFFRICNRLINEEAKKELFSQILLNYEIWMVSSNEDQIQILKHWKNNIYPNFNEYFVQIFDFPSLLMFIRIYFWYNPTNIKEIRGSSKSSRQRNPNLNVKECRGILLEILANFTSKHLTQENFSLLINHILTCSMVDVEQTHDLLNFSLSFEQINNTFDNNLLKTLSCLYPLLEALDDDISISIIKLIISVHQSINELPVCYLIEILLNRIKKRNLTEHFLLCLNEFLYEMPYIFKICSYVSYKLNNFVIYETFKPDEKYSRVENFAYYSILQAISQTGNQYLKIYSFICQCSPKLWKNIYSRIELCCNELEISSSQHTKNYLNMILLIILSESDCIKIENVLDAFSLLKHYLFFQNSRGSIFSKEQDNNINDNKIEKYHFGCRFSVDLEWEDSCFVKYIIQVARIYRSFETIQLSLIVCGFSLKYFYDDIISWISQMNFTQTEIEEHYDDFMFLNYKFIQLGESLSFFIENYTVKEISYSHIQSFHYTLNSELSQEPTNIYNSIIKQEKLVKQIENDYFEKQIDFSSIILSINNTIENIRVTLEQNSKLWQRLWSNVTVDGAPWAISQKQNSIKFKRDCSLCAFNCPFKLKQNYKFNDHMKASFSRDSGSITTAEKLLEEHRKRLEEEYKKSAPPEILETQNILNKQEAELKKIEEKQLSSYECELITIKNKKPSEFIIYPKSLHIVDNETQKSYQIQISKISFIYLRDNYHYQTAIEIFLQNRKAYLINFPRYNSKVIIQRIQSLTSIDHHKIQQQDPYEFFKSQNFTEKWINNKMSTFEYLMKINLYSGRSFNDASQYPFMPWTISDYKSKTLNLEDPNTFRDLSKPIGALNEERIIDLRKKMIDLSEYCEYPYLYSSFAVCPLSVYLWNLRMEPFTSLHIKMQSGKFDHSSRLFSSIEDAYFLVTHHLNDYRELIPEFYFSEEFLINYNNFDLGISHGRKVNDVILPEWANSAIDFIYKMRKALESDYVSSHINNWIDLFWGFKQTGEEAIKADNVYNHDMYKESWTDYSLKNPVRRSEIEATMCHVGQIPNKLFNEPHPTRLQNLPKKQGTISKVKLSNEMIKLSRFCILNDSLKLFIYKNNTVISYNIAIEDSVCKFLEDKSNIIENSIIQILPYNSFPIFLLENGQLYSQGNIVFPEISNVSIITSDDDCIGIVSDETILTLCALQTKYNIPFYGDPITCFVISKIFGIAVCGTNSGKIVICSLYDGIKSIIFYLDDNTKPEKVLITPSWGFILTYASQVISGKTTYYLYLHTINGKLIRKTKSHLISCWYTWSSHKAFDYVIFANEKGNLYEFEAFYLNIRKTFYRCYSEITSLHYLVDEELVISVTKEGQIELIPYSIDMERNN